MFSYSWHTVFSAVLDMHPGRCTGDCDELWPVCLSGCEPSEYPTLALGLLEVVAKHAHVDSLIDGLPVGETAHKIKTHLLDESRGLPEEGATIKRIKTIHNILLEHFRICIGLRRWFDPLEEGTETQASRWDHLGRTHDNLSASYKSALFSAHLLLIGLACTREQSTPPLLSSTAYAGAGQLVKGIAMAALVALAQTPSSLESTTRHRKLPERSVQEYRELAQIHYDTMYSTLIPPQADSIETIPPNHPHSTAITTVMMHRLMTETDQEIAETYGAQNVDSILRANRFASHRLFKFSGDCEAAASIPGRHYHYPQENQCTVTRDTYFSPAGITQESARSSLQPVLDHRLGRAILNEIVSPYKMAEAYAWLVTHFEKMSLDEVLFLINNQLETVLDRASEGDVIMLINHYKNDGSTGYFFGHGLLMIKAYLKRHSHKHLRFFQPENLDQSEVSAYLRDLPPATRVHAVYINDSDYSGKQLASNLPDGGGGGIINVMLNAFPASELHRVHTVAIAARHTDHSIGAIQKWEEWYRSWYTRRHGVSPALPPMEYLGGQRMPTIAEMVETEGVPADLIDALRWLTYDDSLNKPLAYFDFKIPDFVSIPMVFAETPALFNSHWRSFYKEDIPERSVLNDDMTIRFKDPDPVSFAF